MNLNVCHFGDCRDTMRRLIADGVKVQTVVTSPPYWGLRDYGHPGQLGLESTPQEYIERMVEVFALVRELLADDGTLWLNMGDCYAGSGRGGNPTADSSTLQGSKEHQEASMVKRGGRLPAGLHESARQAGQIGRAWVPAPNGLKQKDLVGQPWRLAFALQADGWYLRQDIIWHKPNPMPESVTDRCTKAHEYIFLLSKQDRYYYDADAIKEPASENTNPRRAGNGYKTPDGWDTTKGGGGHGSFHRDGREDGHTGYEHKRRVPGNVTPPKGQKAYEAGDERHRTKSGLLAYAERARDVGVGANARPRKAAPNGSGTKNNASFDAAMAIMPDKRNKRSVWTVATQSYSEAHFATFPEALIEPCILAGSRSGDVVFDPFFGSGTTGQVAQNLGRHWIGCELNRDYEPLQAQRTAQMGMVL